MKMTRKQYEAKVKELQNELEKLKDYQPIDDVNRDAVPNFELDRIKNGVKCGLFKSTSKFGDANDMIREVITNIFHNPRTKIDSLKDEDCCEPVTISPAFMEVRNDGEFANLGFYLACGDDDAEVSDWVVVKDNFDAFVLTTKQNVAAVSKHKYSDNLKPEL